MLFFRPMWTSESQRIGKRQCTPFGYALHVVADYLGFLGALFLITAPGVLALEAIRGDFSAFLLWLFVVPFVFDYLSRLLYDSSWLFATRRDFRYNHDSDEASWLENSQRRIYKYNGRTMSTDQRPPSLAPLRRIRHLALDLDGTLYRGGRLFDATLPFLGGLRNWDIGYTFLTNNTSLSKADYVQKLRRLGIDAGEEQISTPVDSVVAYLGDRLPEAKAIAVLGTPSLCGEFELAGFRITWESPEAVVVGFDTTLTYERLCRAAYWIRSGVPFLATHPDLVCPTDEPAVLVDCGSICACLSAATGRQPLVFGKPDPAILRAICSLHSLDAAELAMVGDRLYTDMAMAQKAGAVSVLVLSGEATAAEAAALDPPPDFIMADVGELGRLLEEAGKGAAP